MNAPDIMSSDYEANHIGDSDKEADIDMRSHQNEVRRVGWTW